MKVRFVQASDVDRDIVARATKDRSFQSNYHEAGSLSSMRSGALAVAGSGLVRQPSDAVRVTALEIAGVACERLSPPHAEGSRIILYLHGGGFVRGSLDLQRGNAGLIGELSGLEVIAIGYRQAPEHPFPCAPDDLYAVYEALLSQGVEPSSIVVVGESSGGCLALVLAAMLRDQQHKLPAGIAALSPMTDLSLQGASWRYNAGKDVIDAETGRRLVGLYLGDASPAQALASPIRHDFDGCCPLFIGIGSHETMLSDTEFLARKASDAGVAVELEIYEAMPHGFSRFEAEISRRALGAVAQWCRERLMISNAG
jgi:epsilon-lactone hydrolase